jgi:PBSX family phage terminase large subunit
MATSKTLRVSLKPLPEILTNNKILDALAIIVNPETRLFTMEGTIRSAKTITAIIGFHLRVQRQKAKYALIAAEDYNAIRTNILDAELGLLALYPEKYKFSKDPIGGFYIEVIGTDKEIILCGYSDTSKWEKILGKDIETILIDEVNIADENFVRETFARQGATDEPITIFTLNGDDPQHIIYQERINKSLIIGDCPASIRADMDAVKVKKRGYYYMHFAFKDNPKLTPKMIRSLNTLFPVGSYYHKTKILGERGKWGIMIFADYMTTDLLVDLNEKDANGKPKYPIAKYTIGVDIAEARASNVFALVGWDKDYKYCGVVDLMVFLSAQNGIKVGYTQKTELLKAFLNKHAGKAIEGIFVDSAEGNYIKDLQAIGSIQNRAPVAPSYKATIKERIDLLVTLFSRGRCLFDVQKAIQAFQAYQASTWVKGKEGKEREDNNLPMNDIMDAVEYAITRHMNALLAAVKRMVA